MIEKILLGVLGGAIALFSWLGIYHPPEKKLGLSIPIPTAFFLDSLANSVAKTDTSLTLVTGNDSAGAAISGFYGFVLDEGTASQEVITATASGTSLTAAVRGIDPNKGYATSSALQFAHRRGASVKVTTSPWILVVHQILSGSSTLPVPLQYSAHPPSPSSTTIPDVDYVNGVATSGAANAAYGVKGLVDLATTSQLAAGTATSSLSGTVFLAAPSPAFGATSTARVMVPVTKTNGKLSQGFYDLSGETWTFGVTTTLSSTTNLSGTTNITGTLNATGTANFASSSIPDLNQSRVTSTASFDTQSTSYVVITGASTTITIGQNHRAYLSFSGSAMTDVAGSNAQFNFSVNSSTIYENAAQTLLGFAAATYRAPVGYSFLTDVLSTTSTQAFTFRAIVKLNGAGSTTVCGVLGSNGCSGWIFNVIEIY